MPVWRELANGVGEVEVVIFSFSDPNAPRKTGVRELGIGFVPYRPFGKGFLTEKINENTTLDSSDIRNAIPMFAPKRPVHESDPG